MVRLLINNVMLLLQPANDNVTTRRAFHVSEMSDEDIEAISRAEVPPGNEYLDELLE